MVDIPLVLDWHAQIIFRKPFSVSDNNNLQYFCNNAAGKVIIAGTGTLLAYLSDERSGRLITHVNHLTIC